MKRPHISEINIPAIADDGKVLTSHAREVARYYLLAAKEIKKLKAEVERAIGGPKVTYKGRELQGKHLSVSTFTRADGTLSAGWMGRLDDQIDDLLRHEIQLFRGAVVNTLTGAQEKCERFLELNELITKAIQEAYDEGHKDGKALLRGLADGTFSLEAYEDPKLTRRR